MQISLVFEVVLMCIALGIFATAFMDACNILCKKLRIHNGGSYALIGRWIGGFFRGNFRYHNILQAEPLPNELLIGGLAHYAIGIGLSVLYYLISQTIGLPVDHLLWAVVFGIFTNVLPWFWMFPAFGFGVLASRGPENNTLLRSSFLNHFAFGVALGVGAKVLLLAFK